MDSILHVLSERFRDNDTVSSVYDSILNREFISVELPSVRHPSG